MRRVNNSSRFSSLLLLDDKLEICQIRSPEKNNVETKHSFRAFSKQYLNIKILTKNSRMICIGISDEFGFVSS